MSNNKTYKLLLIPRAGKYDLLDPHDIKYIQSCDNYCKVVSSTGSVHLLRITLREMETRMSKINFRDTVVLRVHEQCIISLKYVTNFDTLRTCAYFDKVELPISRKYRQQLDEYLDLY